MSLDYGIFIDKNNQPSMLVGDFPSIEAAQGYRWSEDFKKIIPSQSPSYESAAYYIAPYILPQQGFQMDFLSTKADIAIGGGAAGAGKSFALLIEPLNHIHVNGFTSVIYRRTTPQIRQEGGLWDTSKSLYNHIKTPPRSNEQQLLHKFPSGAKIKFSHMEHEKDRLAWDGSQITYIGFDELIHFTEKQFFYLLSRNRSLCGVRPYVRATTNPDADSWVAELISWWIDPETGFIIKQRCGKLRYFFRDGDDMIWGDSKEEVIRKCWHILKEQEGRGVDIEEMVKSFTFIEGDLFDNKKLIKINPSYVGNLYALSEVERQRLLEKNWKVRLDGMTLCDYDKVEQIFSNYVPDSNQYRITCDVARLGQDFAVILVWKGNEIIKTIIFTISTTDVIRKAIEDERKTFFIPTDKVVVDEDGVGGGVVDEGKYVGFMARRGPLKSPVTGEPENYEDRKTQFAYRFAESYINNNNIRVNLDNVWVDGKRTKEITIGKNIYSISMLFRENYKSAKKEVDSSRGKKRIKGKEQQKAFLQKTFKKALSPDCWDASTLIVQFDYMDANTESSREVSFEDDYQPAPQKEVSMEIELENGIKIVERGGVKYIIE